MCEENRNLKRHIYLNVHCSTIYNSQDIEATQMSIDEWIKKIWDVYAIEY